MARLRRAVIVHYHEISLKRGNRGRFLAALGRNLERATADLAGVRRRQLPGRIVLDLAGDAEADAVLARAADVCGVSSVSPALAVASTTPAMKTAIDALIDGCEFASFRISARRAFKTFPLTSVDLNRELGAFVLGRARTRVDLRSPELNIHVEVLPAETFVYLARVPGPGGLPVGASGTVAALLSGGIDSPVAAWRLMKRGCRVVFVHFHSVPYLPDTSQVKARDLVERLTRWQYHSRLHLVAFGPVQREVLLAVPPRARVVVYRRLMVRIAEVLARRAGALALVTGESLGQVASQTLANIARIDEVASLPILRPLIGMDKLEITAEARRLGTYETSIEPDADCCTLFVPEHPSTGMTAGDVDAAEAGLDIPKLVEMGCGSTVAETFEFPASRPA
jgi:thiamine biosynthesis protein ThiI